MKNRNSFINLKFSSQRIDHVYNIRKDPKSIIGKGSFGFVIRAEDKITGQIRAVKIINKVKLQQQDAELELLSNEFNIMLNMDHPNIVRLYEVFEDQKYIYFVMEHLKGKTLFEALVSEDFQLTENTIRDIFFQLTKGMQYLHKNGVVHRDLKPENIMFVNAKTNQIKIIDFGVSKYFISREESNKQITLRTQAGSLYYISPEIIEGSYDYLCDIWSAGVILYSLFAGIPPFWDMDPSLVINKIKNFEFDFKNEAWQEVSPQAIDLIKNLLAPRFQRYTTDQILEHEWMKMQLDNKKYTNNSAAIKKFFVGKTLSRYILEIITACSSETDNQTLGELFVKIDEDGDGLISRESLIEGIKVHFRIYDEELCELIMTKFAKDQKINYNSFLTAVNAIHNYSNFEKRVEKAFQLIDRGNLGKINGNDIKEAFKKMKITEPSDSHSWDDLVSEVDKDKKGYLCIADFKNMMSFYVNE